MYAIIKTGGHQYRVNKGDEILIEKLIGKEGDQVTFDEVVMVGGATPVIGAPLVKGAKVEGKIKAQILTEKVPVFKYHRRKSYKRNKGHRQQMTSVEITNVVG